MENIQKLKNKFYDPIKRAKHIKIGKISGQHIQMNNIYSKKFCEDKCQKQQQQEEQNNLMRNLRKKSKPKRDKKWKTNSKNQQKLPSTFTSMSSNRPPV